MYYTIYRKANYRKVKEISMLSCCCEKTCYYYLLAFISLLLSTSCTSFQESAKYELNNGYYKVRAEGGEDQKVYVYINEDTLVAYPLIEKVKPARLDTSSSAALAFPEVISSTNLYQPQIFHEYSFDLDVLAILFKYRPKSESLPRQLNTQYNGALYAGYRTDRYKVFYKPTPLGIADRSVTHYGYSVGLFSGIGTEAINPWVTNDKFPGEYDGMVWLNGVAAIVGINQFTFGLSVGIDYLLDSNRNIWIYQGKPWVGLALGLNLN